MNLVNNFGVIDYIVVVFTLLFSLLIGLYYAFAKKQSNEELLVGGRKMNPIPIAISMLVTYLSAITILGYPAEIYAHGLQIFLMTLISMVHVPLAGFVFVSVFYKMKLTSIYEYLEYRFDSVVVRWVAAFVFIIQVTFISGIILYAPSMALEIIIGLKLWISILVIGILGTIYTSIGGLRAVVWTDTFQFVMIIIGMVSIVVKGMMKAGGFLNAFQIAEENGRLELFNFTFDPFMRHNFWNFLFGYGFAVIALYGTHQPLVQRYCSLPTLKHVYQAIALCIPLNIFVTTLVVFTGVSIFATYHGCDPVKLGHIKKPDHIVSYFVIQELMMIPGLLGIFVSCLFSAVLSSISSALNSLAAVTWQDFLSKIKYFQNLGPTGQSNTTKIVSSVYGVIIILFGLMAQHLGAVLQATFTAVGATAGSLGGIFVIGLFFPFINKHGAYTGMLFSLVIMSYLAVQAYFLDKEKKFNNPLPSSVENCPEFLLINATIAEDYIVPQIDWPEKIYSMSYILYSFIGALITIFVGTIVSGITGGFAQSKKVKRKYLHPFLRREFFSFCVSNNLEDDDEDANEEEKWKMLSLDTDKKVDRLRLNIKEKQDNNI